MAAELSPAHSRSSSTSSKKGRKTPLTLDLSDLPPLIEPSPPSNTLIITNLLDADIFHPTNILTLRDLINSTAPIHTWAPLKSFKRIIVTFYSIESAISIRQQLDGTVILTSRLRIYFGEPVSTTPTDQHLPLPQSDRLFFISPPPSPPHGWEMRNEGPPNKEVHANDLAEALAKLHARPIGEMPSPTSPGMEGQVNRQRSGSHTLVYHPREHGDSPHLPAISVEDTTTASPEDWSPMEGVETGKPITHTSRPPVELME